MNPHLSKIFSKEFESLSIYWERVVEDQDFRILLIGGPEYWGDDYFFQILEEKISSPKKIRVSWHPGKPEGMLPFLRLLQGDGLFRAPLKISLEELQKSDRVTTVLSQPPNRLGDIFQGLESPSLVYFSHFEHAHISLAEALAELSKDKMKISTLVVVSFISSEGEIPPSLTPLSKISVPILWVKPFSEKESTPLAKSFFEGSRLPLSTSSLANKILAATGSQLERAFWMARYLACRTHRFPDFQVWMEGFWDDWEVLSLDEKTFLQMVAVLFYNTPLSWEMVPKLASSSSMQAYWGLSERQILLFMEDLREFLSPNRLKKIYRTIPEQVRRGDHLKGAELFSLCFPESTRPFEVEYQRALHLYRAGEIEQAGESYLRAGTSYGLSTTPEEAASLIEQAVESFEQAEDKEKIAGAMMELGWAYYRSGDPNLALKNLQNSRLLFRGLKGAENSIKMEKTILGEALVWTHLLNDYERAATRCREILDKDLSFYQPWARILMGYGLFKRGQERKGEEEIRQGIQEAREKNHREMIFEGLLYLGTILRRKSSKPDQLEAESCLREVLQSENPSLVAKSLDGLGRLYSNTFKLKEALRLFSLSISLKLDLGDRLGAALSLGGKGIVLLRKGLFHEAVECFLRDLEILGTQKTVPVADYATVYCNLADALRLLGNFDQALEALQKAREEEEKIPDFELRNHILGWIEILEGSTYASEAQSLKIGSMREEKILRAKKYLEDVLPRFAQNSSLGIEVKLLHVKILALENQVKEAREVLEKILEEPNAPYLSAYYLAWIHFEYARLLPSNQQEKHLAISYEIARKYENDWFMSQIIQQNDGQVPLGGIEIAIIYGEDEVVSPEEEWTLKFCVYDSQSRPRADTALNVEIFSEEGEPVQLFSLTTQMDGTGALSFQSKNTGSYRAEIHVEGRARKVMTFEISGQEIRLPAGISLSYTERVVMRKLFSEYPLVEVVEEVGGGLGGSRLFIVQPITQSGRKAAWVISKIGTRAYIEGEREGALIFRRYHNLHAATILENHCPECRGKAGIKYVFLSPFGKDRAIIPLEEWFFKSRRLSEFLSHTFEDILSPHFYSQCRIKMIQGSLEYGKHFPENLRILMDRPPEGIYEGEPPLIEGYVNIPLRKIREEEDRIPVNTKIILEGLKILRIIWLPEENWNQVTLILSDEGETGIWIRAKIHLFSLLRAGIDPRENPTTTYTLVGTVISHRSTVLKEGIEKVVESFGDDQIYLSEKTFHLHNQTYPNPFSLYREFLLQKSLGKLSPIHGDLTVRNIMVDIFDQPWFIDFEYSQEEGHVLKDFIKLETSIRTFIITRRIGDMNFPEEYILFEESLLRPKHNMRCRDEELERARKMILSIREQALPHLAVKSSWKEYFRSLFLYNLSLLKYTSPDEMIYRRLNFITAAILAKALTERHEESELENPLREAP